MFVKLTIDHQEQANASKGKEVHKADHVLNLVKHSIIRIVRLEQVALIILLALQTLLMVGFSRGFIIDMFWHGANVDLAVLEQQIEQEVFTVGV